MLLNTISKIISVISEKGAIKKIITKKNFSFASYKINRALKTHIGTLNTIIDAGANQGQFALMASDFFPTADIYSFEPVPETFAILKNNTAHLKGKINCYNLAVGNESGHIKFYKNKYSHVSSALPIDEKNQHPKYQSDVNEISVPLVTLDSILSSVEINRPSLLKLDVQGFEREVIGGASSVLFSVDFIIIEMPFFELYENQPLFNELDELLNKNGFKLFLPMDVNYGADKQIIEIDFLYKRQ